MRTLLLSVLLSAGLLHSGPSSAQLLLQHAVRSNAVNHCQAFTPGPSNTIRNRVVGIENVGVAPVTVACAFASHDSIIYTLPTSLRVYTSNATSQPASVSCTLLSGYFGESDAYAVTKTVTVPPATVRGPWIEFNSSDNPVPLSITLGDTLLGINCTLPPGVGLNETNLTWAELL